MNNRAGLLLPLLLAACAARETQPDAAPEPAAPVAKKPAAPTMKVRKPTERLLGFAHPDAWVEEEPANRMRRVQFKIFDKQEEQAPAQLAVFHFRVASSIEQNIRRWATQMGVGETKPEKLEGKCPVTLVDLKGTYMGDSENDPIGDARMLAAIVEAPDGQWFFKLVGPSRTVGDWRNEFVSLLKSAHR